MFKPGVGGQKRRKGRPAMVSITDTKMMVLRQKRKFASRKRTKSYTQIKSPDTVSSKFVRLQAYAKTNPTIAPSRGGGTPQSQYEALPPPGPNEEPLGFRPAWTGQAWTGWCIPESSSLIIRNLLYLVHLRAFKPCNLENLVHRSVFKPRKLQCLVLLRVLKPRNLQYF